MFAASRRPPLRRSLLDCRTSPERMAASHGPHDMGAVAFEERHGVPKG
jgi:hypothetical protein